MKKTIYGGEHTKLTLTAKASEAYGNSDVTIVEYTSEDDGSVVCYSLYEGRYLSPRHLISENLTEEEVNEFFCNLADELAENDLAYLKQDILDEIDSNLTPEEAEAAGYLTVNTARNGRDVVWYFDGINQLAYYIDNRDKLTDDEIEEQLA